MDSMVTINWLCAAEIRWCVYSGGLKPASDPIIRQFVLYKILKEISRMSPVVIGGIEASMRRLTALLLLKDKLEPQYWLAVSDMLIYGMVNNLSGLLKLLSKGFHFHPWKLYARHHRYKNDEQLPVQKKWKDISLHSFEKCLKDKKLFAENFIMFEKVSNKSESARLSEATGDLKVIINPPFSPMNEADADAHLIYLYVSTSSPLNKKEDIRLMKW